MTLGIEIATVGIVTLLEFGFNFYFVEWGMSSEGGGELHAQAVRYSL